MKHKIPALAGILLVALALWTGCKEPSTLGASLIDEDGFDNFLFTDAITLRCTIEREDSSLTSDISSTAEYFLCGELNDPEFGKSSSEIFALMLAENLNPNFNLTTQAFDSIVMYLRYAPAGVYGDTLAAMQTLKVLRLDAGQQIKADQTYYSTNSFSASEELGSVTFLPRPNTRDSLFEGVEGSFLRVVLKPEFGQELFNIDSLSYAVDSTFYKKLRGLKIVTTSGATPGAMLAFNLNDNALSRMRLYYHEIADSSAKNFDYYFKGTNKFTHFQHEHQGSPAGQLIGVPYADQKIYVQGMHGLRVKIEFPDAQLLDNIAVNQAQLILTVAEDNTGLPPASQLFFTQLQEDSNGDTVHVLTSDVLFSFGSNLTGGFLNFGGTPNTIVDNGTIITQYRLTLSELFQHIVDDTRSDTKNRTVYLGVYPRSRTAGRSILYGPESLNYPAKLELTYTKIQ